MAIANELFSLSLWSVNRLRPHELWCPRSQDELLVVLDSIYDGLKDASDRALLLIGFAEGFRRSELAGLNVEDIEPVRQGIIIHLRRPKTDQEGTGWKICIPFGRSRHCPVAAIEQRPTRSGITQGPLFRPVDPHGVISNLRLSGEAVSLVIKERVAALESIRPVTRGTACEQDWRPAPLNPVPPLGRSGSRQGTPRMQC